MIGLGTIVGELIGIERFFDKFVNAFVTASLTVCIGAMAIVGAIQDGILGDLNPNIYKSI